MARVSPAAADAPGRPAVHPAAADAPGCPAAAARGSAAAPGRRTTVTRALAGAAVIATLVAACGSSTSSAASPSPSDIAVALPTPIQVTARPSMTPDPGPTSAPAGGPSGSPGTLPSATTAPTPIPTPVRDFALESTFPSEFEGMPIDRTSAILTDAVAASQDAAFKPIVDFLAGLGLKPHDLSQGAALPADRSKGWEMVAYRAKGSTEPDMLPAFLEALTASGRAKTVGSAEVGGRSYRTFTSSSFTGPLAGSTEYLFQKGDTIYGVVTADVGLAARLLAALR